ncbi:acyloxyacyl hydrolase [Mucilaginibacter psychrotolerans]|uniref:Acyloxyacyl hydrolase n=1 Tax=Mucilaginibacter psychrotolerans TaxID=1524096 RepID=A0A4Y8SII9_9SPHI|nr:acyloxyacyl hydrolase [Mucilaginibacter psychrotolerans]TFF38470.1 hypothetical protein E2R66_08350 [Mucilaginibacter psychrotolerans]
MKKIALSLSLLLSFARLVAQTGNTNKIELNALYGLNTFTSGFYKTPGHMTGAEAIYHFDMGNNKAPYIQLLHIQSIDVVAGFRNFSKVSVIDSNSTVSHPIGQVYNVLGRLEIPVIKAGGTQLIFAPGLGFAYATGSYFSNGNPLIGSHINLATEAGLFITTPLSNTIALKGGIDIFHYSNGGTRVPNKGINTVEASFGLIKTLNTPGPQTGSKAFSTYFKHSFEIGLDAGRRGVQKADGGLYKSGFSAAYNYRISPAVSLKAGADAVYYFSIYHPDDDPKTNLEPSYQYHGSSFDRWRYGLSGGTDLWMGRLAIMANYGFYLHYKSTTKINSYWSPGVKYYVLPWVALQVKAYIHGSDCDYLGGGLIFRAH